MGQIPNAPPDDLADTVHLHQALFAAYDSNWGLTTEALSRALAVGANGFSPENVDDWHRASAVLLHLNYGKELLAFLDERDFSARLRPWVEALRAHQQGDRRVLQNIAPEVRGAAEIVYDAIQQRLDKLPEKTRRRPTAPVQRSRKRDRGERSSHR
jgi:hypothetical protein